MRKREFVLTPVKLQEKQALWMRLSVGLDFGNSQDVSGLLIHTYQSGFPGIHDHRIAVCETYSLACCYLNSRPFFQPGIDGQQQVLQTILVLGSRKLVHCDHVGRVEW